MIGGFNNKSREVLEVLYNELERDEKFSYPSWEPKYSYDGAFFRGFTQEVKSDIVGTSSSKKDWPSDHCSYYIDLIL